MSTLWRSKPARTLALAAAGLALLAAVAYVLTQAGPLAPVRITVATVESAALKPGIFGIGTVEARTAWSIGPTATGRILRVLVDTGDSVRAGQVVAEMDPVDFQERLRALDAAVQRAHSAQAAARALWEEAQARRTLAAQQARRNEELAAQEFISASALESRHTELQQAQAVVAAARANLDSSAQEIARLQAERAGAAQQRGVLRMLAPAGGVVISREAEPGSTVVGGQTVLRLVDPQSLWVRMRVDQGRAEGLAAGLPARVVLRSRPKEALAGRVARVELQADSVTEERIAQVALDAPAATPGSLPALGELAEVTVALAPTAAAPVVANASVQYRQGQAGVWRLDDGKPHFVPVQLGASSLDGQVQVLQGLRNGDTVVVYSQAPLREGQRVRVQDALLERSARP